MAYTKEYLAQEPTREHVDALSGLTLLEFGAPNCGHCSAIQSALSAVLRDHPVEHLKVEDGSGRPLGRSFKVKLWPTFIAVRDGHEMGRVVRPFTGGEIAALLT